jgi:general L-amino acid transport system permease protein
MTGAVNSAIKQTAAIRSNTLVTFAILLIAWKIVPPFIDWAFFNAVWSPENPNLCRAVAGRGACWAFIVNSSH